MSYISTLLAKEYASDCEYAVSEQQMLMLARLLRDMSQLGGIPQHRRSFWRVWLPGFLEQTLQCYEILSRDLVDEDDNEEPTDICGVCEGVGKHPEPYPSDKLMVCRACCGSGHEDHNEGEEVND